MSWVSWPCRNAAASGPEISTMARSSSLAATSGKEFMDVILLKSVELLKPVGLSKPVKPMKSVELSKPVKQGGHSVYDSGLWRSEERRVGKECVSRCRSCWSPYT